VCGGVGLWRLCWGLWRLRWNSRPLGHRNLHRDRRHNKAFAHFRDNNLLHTKSPIPSFYTIGRGKIGLRFLLGFCKECLLGC
jgi:hypothetical protein